MKGERWLAKDERWLVKDETWLFVFYIGGIVDDHCLDFLFIISPKKKCMYTKLHSRFQILIGPNQTNPWSPLLGPIVLRPIEFPSLGGDKGRQCW